MIMMGVAAIPCAQATLWWAVPECVAVSYLQEESKPKTGITSTLFPMYPHTLGHNMA